MVRMAAKPTSAARSVPRSRSPVSDAHQGGRPPRAGSRVSHQNKNSTSMIPAAITDGSSHVSPVTAAVRVCGPDRTSTPCQRSSQPQACARAYNGAGRKNEREHRAEQQREDAHQHRRAVRRDVAGVVTKVALLRGVGRVSARPTPAGQAVSLCPGHQVVCYQRA